MKKITKTKKKTIWHPFTRSKFLKEDIDTALKQTKELFPNLTDGQMEENAEFLTNAEVWVNNIYQVVLRDVKSDNNFPEMIHMSIKRLDREVIRDWRHLQRIKNELVGHENEAVELFPAESRRIDTSNKYHMWCLKDPHIRFPFGFYERSVTSDVYL